MKTPLTIVAGPSAHQQEMREAMTEGLTRHGVPVVPADGLSGVNTHNVACWSWHGGQVLHNRGHNVLVMERGYLGDRFAWTSLGWNGLNNRAYAPTPPDGRRFRTLFGHLMRPWAPTGKYVLLIGQVPHDAALQGKDLSPWYQRTAEQAAAIWGLPVRFRAHPGSIERGIIERVPGAEPLAGSLSQALAGARVVITFNSNTGVEAVLAGKPTIALDEGSMAWPVAQHALIDDTAEPDRETWAGHLAWRQWSLEEIRSGYAWDVMGLPLGNTPALRVQSNVR